MPSAVSEIGFVDLKRSEWDRKESDPEKGVYAITKKVYYKNKDFKEGYIHPWKLKWCKFTEFDVPRPFYTYELWRVQFKAQFLTTKDDYWPEGLAPDVEGKYVFGDLVAVKIPIEIHVAKKKEAVAKSERQAGAVKKKFEDEAKREGINLPEGEMDEEAERLRREGDTMGV